MTTREDAPSASDLREALHLTLTSDGWQQVVLPKLKSRLELARASLEDGAKLEIADVRALQAEIRLLREIVERPETMFKP